MPTMNTRKMHVCVVEESASMASSREIFNKKVLLERIGGQAALMPRLLTMFFSTADEILACLERSLAEKDSNEVRKQAHALKGVAANVGADRMYAVVAELETIAGKEELAEFAREMHQLRAEYDLFKSIALG